MVEHVERIAAARASGRAGRAEVEAALRSVGSLQAWLAELEAALASQVSCPEQAIAECTRGSSPDAIDDKAR